jgi:hypothetical protein
MTEVKLPQLRWWQYLYYSISAAVLVLNFLRTWIWIKPLPISPILTRTLYQDSQGNLSMTFNDITRGTIIITESSGQYGTFQWLLGSQRAKLIDCVGPNAACNNEGTMTFTPSINGYTWTAPLTYKLPQQNFTATIIYS